MPTLDVVRGTSPIRRTFAVALATGSLVGAIQWTDAPTAAAQTTCGNTDATPTLTASTPTVSATSVSTISVTGSDYLVPPHTCGANVFGGIYVFFGWVAPGDKWGPSWRGDGSNGQFGFTYSYPGDGGGETRDDGSGLVRLVSFTNGGTSGAETPFHMDAGGNFSTTLTVRGALYSWVDSTTGASSTVDCRSVQCGVFTVGAHGKNSRTNERFTPVTFRNDGPAPTVAPGGISSGTSPGTAAPRGVIPNAATPRSAGTAGTAGAAGAAAGNGSATGTPSGATPGGAAANTTTAPDATAPDTTAPADADGEEIAVGADGHGDGGSTGERTIVAGEVVSMTDFDSSGGSGGLALLLVATATAAAAVAAGWWSRRNRLTAAAAAATATTKAGDR